MNVRTKLVITIFIFLAFIGITGYFTIVIGEEIIRNEIGKRSLFFTENLMNDLDHRMHMRLDEMKLYSKNGFLQETLYESNSVFEKMEDREAYIDQQDTLWRDSSNEEAIIFIDSLINSPLSNELKKRIDFYDDSVMHGHKKMQHGDDGDMGGEEMEEGEKGTVFSEIFVTNKYGANVAQTGKTSDYRQNDEGWWQNGKEKEISIEGIGFDESASVYSKDIIIRVDDNEEFLGVIKAVVNLEEVISIIKMSENNGEVLGGNKFTLITKSGKFIYATGQETIKPLEDISEKEYYKEITNDKGNFVLHDKETGKEKLFSYVVLHREEGSQEEEWILLLELETNEILAPLFKLKNAIILLSIILGIIMMVIILFISYSISRPIRKLSKAASEIGQGNLNVKTEINTKDELGLLAKTIDKMVGDLKDYRKKLLQSQITHGKELESEVKKKTKDLEIYVGRLEKSRSATLNILRDLKEGNERLQELDKAKGNFLNIVSHELKTPLTAIFAYLDIMEESKGKFTEEILMSFKAVKRNSDQLQALINNILEISRIQAGKFELIPTKLNVNKKIKEVVENLRPLAEHNKNKLVAKIGNIPKSIITDEQRFVEILNNLISNAIKFTENGTITVEGKRKGKKLLVSVHDTGVGIPEEKVNNLFQKFYQVDANISRKYGGTGLGLSITKQLIELQGGEIWVESKRGKGSVFSFTLPAKTKVKKEVIKK